MSKHFFKGIYTAVVTPFQVDGSIDKKAFIRVLEQQKKAGIHGIVVCGSTGEKPVLTDEEEIDLFSIALEFQDKDFQVIANVGMNDTRHSIDFAKRVLTLSKKVDGMMAVVPYYNKPCQRGMQAHFSGIARSIGDIPMIIYNVPSRTGSRILPETYENIVRTEQNVVAIKEAAGDLNAFWELNQRCPDTCILCGEDSLLAHSLLYGACGLVSVASHVVPKPLLNLYNAYQEGNLPEFQRIQQDLFPLFQKLFCAPNPSPVKYALSTLDICAMYVRLPLIELQEEYRKVIQDSLFLLKNKGYEIG